MVNEPEVYHRHTREEAVAALGDPSAAAFYCDAHFVVLPKVVLCFLTVADASGSSVPSPTVVQWVPPRRDYHPGEEPPWLPRIVNDVYDRSVTPVRKLRDHHLFLRLPSDTSFVYAGGAHLGSFGGTPEGVHARFYLAEKLPRDLWLRFGGYPGWLIEVNHRVHQVAEGDRPAFERLLKRLPKQEFSHLTMTRYAEDSLTLHTNARRGWLMYLETPADPGLYARDPELSGDPEAEELFECTCGIDLEYPAAQTLPRDRAIQAAMDFFLTGQLPQSIPWTDE
jgi:hypothetical protein